MDKELEESANRTLSLGLQQIRMLLIENQIGMVKQKGEINNEQYGVFREVADKQWGKWSRKVKRLSKSKN